MIRAVQKEIKPQMISMFSDSAEIEIEKGTYGIGVLVHYQYRVAVHINENTFKGPGGVYNVLKKGIVFEGEC